MIRSAVTVNLVEETRGGPFVFFGDLPDACRQARTLGFDGIEVFGPSAAPLVNPELPRLLQDHGLVLAAAGSGAGWARLRLHLCLPEPSVRQQARAFIRELVDAAGTLHAPVIIGSMQGRTSATVDYATALGYLADALEDLGEHARQYQVPLLFEPLNRYETDLITNVDAGLKLLASLSTHNVRLLADLFHMNIEEVDTAAAIRLAGDRLGHVHFVDSNRRPAGCGHVQYAPIVVALNEIGYQGFASAEALPWPDSTAAATQTIKAFRQYFRTAQA